MANREWTQDQREKAAKEICMAGEADGKAFFKRHPDLGYSVCLEIQMENNHLREQIKEARKLLLSYSKVGGYIRDKEIEAWLSSNP